jgi:hypothetical protein
MRVSIFLALLLGLAGCGGWQPMEVPRSGDIKPGPGLLSGSSGEFVLRRPR